MFTLDKVVPWGRSFEEYQKMFALPADASNLRILGCGDGPASFNCEATRRGWSVVSCDPIYRFDVNQLRERINATSLEILEQTQRNAKSFIWDSIRSVEELGQMRMATMDEFLHDFPEGRNAVDTLMRSCRVFLLSSDRLILRFVHIFYFSTPTTLG